MYVVYKQIISSGLMLLLVTITHANNDSIKESNDSSVGRLSAKERTQGLIKKIGGIKIVAIDNDDLKSILILETPLLKRTAAENATKNFLTEFTHFLIPFSWTETEKNELLVLAANYNKNHFENNRTNNHSVHLWVSFQPRSNDVRDDIEAVIDATNKGNSIFSGTVYAVVLNYGLLQLETESLLVVNHEIKKVNKILRDTLGNKVVFALQMDVVNCKVRMKLFQKLEQKDVEIILFSESTREATVTNDNDFNLAIGENMICLLYQLKKGSLPVIHTHMSVSINLGNGSYDYNKSALKFLNTGNFSKIFPLFFWADIVDTQKRNNNNSKLGENNEIIDLQRITYLQRPVEFQRKNFGGVISAVHRFPPRIFEHFDKIIVDVSDDTPDTRKQLEQIMTDLVRHSSFNEKSDSISQKKHNPPQVQISLLVTITKNDFEANKRQVDNAIWAAVYGNQFAADSVNGIVLDWNSCGISEDCSGYQNKNPNIYCSFYKMEKDMEQLSNYTRRGLDKTESVNTISIDEMVDTNIVSKIIKTTFKQGCDEGKDDEGFKKRPLKFTLSEKDLQQNGAVKMLSTITAQLNLYGDVFKRDDRKVIPYAYVKIMDCSRNYSSITHLTEFTMFYEILSKLGTPSNIVVYADAGIENPDDCQQKEMGCKCGWWVGDQTSAVGFPHKKELAVKLYESQRKSSSTTNVVKSTATFSTDVLLSILIPSFFVVALITATAVALVLWYKSKYILTRKEVANFLKGKLQSRSISKSLPEYANILAESKPYDSAKYELTPSSFTIDKSSCVGSGEFGMLYRCTIKTAGGQKDSGVKVANTRTLGKSHTGRVALLGLLSEIKILAYLGEHDHIVALLGAFTGNLRKGEISVFLEFCELGSLYTYLRSIHQPNQQEANGSVEDEDDIALMMIIASQRDSDAQQHHSLDSSLCDELYGYCGQIASGMAFLVSKNVVHADLATRNVLLTREKVVKICDFGLSRRMYDYTEYVKRSQSPLPWRWMPPESLQRLIFNEKSDVWAFGITLWEIFTLGDEPYPGLSYHVNFPAMLERGVRLPAPRYNVKQIYSVMKRCWNVVPAERPSFVELHAVLSE